MSTSPHVFSLLETICLCHFANWSIRFLMLYVKMGDVLYSLFMVCYKFFLCAVYFLVLYTL